MWWIKQKPIAEAGGRALTTEQNHEQMPAWIAERAAFREAIAVCPQCDPCLHQVMTAEQCSVIAYILDGCRNAQCCQCGKQRLCFLFVPQESATDWKRDNGWGMAEPSVLDKVAFDEDKHVCLQEAIEEQRQRKTLQSVAGGENASHIRDVVAH